MNLPFDKEWTEANFDGAHKHRAYQMVLTKLDKLTLPELEKWLKSLPWCPGYPDCDGQLRGGKHVPKCPLYGIKHWQPPGLLDAWKAATRSALNEACRVLRQRGPDGEAAANHLEEHFGLSDVKS